VHPGAAIVAYPRGIILGNHLFRRLNATVGKQVTLRTGHVLAIVAQPSALHEE
jgi:ABC-type lipoprotein release transport system permease subunit